MSCTRCCVANLRAVTPTVAKCPRRCKLHLLATRMPRHPISVVTPARRLAWIPSSQVAFPFRRQHATSRQSHRRLQPGRVRRVTARATSTVNTHRARIDDQNTHFRGRNKPIDRVACWPLVYWSSLSWSPVGCCGPVCVHRPACHQHPPMWQQHRWTRLR